MEMPFSTHPLELVVNEVDVASLAEEQSLGLYHDLLHQIIQVGLLFKDPFGQGQHQLHHQTDR